MCKKFDKKVTKKCDFLFFLSTVRIFYALVHYLCRENQKHTQRI